MPPGRRRTAPAGPGSSLSCFSHRMGGGCPAVIATSLGLSWSEGGAVREGVSGFGNRLDRRDRVEILERVCAGETQLEVACALGTTERTVRRVLQAAGGAPSRRSRRRPRSPLRLSLAEREEVRAGIA